MSADQAIKEPCRVSTASNITLSGLQTIDGVTTVAGDRVLVRAQSSAVANGVYLAASGAWSRAADFDGPGEVVGGTQVAVTSGSDRGGSAWRVAGAGPITIATDPIPFEPAYDSGSVTFLQAGTGTDERGVEDRLRDCLDVRDFAGADPTGNPSNVAANTAAFQAAVAEAVASGRPLRISRGEWHLNDTVTLSSYTEQLNIFGDGMHATRIINKAVNKKPLFAIGNTYFCSIRDLSIEGNGLTGTSGNGHAIDMKNPGTIGASTFLPGMTKVERLRIIDHLGTATNHADYGGADMPACAIYMAGSLSTLVDHCYLRNNGFGVYALRCAQPEVRSCTWDAMHYAALVNDQCENLKLVNPDIVGDNTQATSGQLMVNNGGAQSGGYNVRAGAVVDWLGIGSVYSGGKYKNHEYTALSLFSFNEPLVTGAYIRQEVPGCVGVYGAYGARVIANEFALANFDANPFSGARTGVMMAPTNTISHFGCVEDNVFSLGGQGAFGTFIEIDGSGALQISGSVRGNKAGGTVDPGATCTISRFIKVTTAAARRLTVADNHVVVPNNVTLALAYDYSGISAQVDEGLIDDANSANGYGGGAITAVKSLPSAYTGLQPNAKLNVNALTVQGTQVVGARDTGWTAASGTAAKGAYATYAGQTVSNPPTMAQVQATDNAVKALSQRFKALEDAARAHGLIN